MVWPSLTKGERVRMPINDRDWSSADVNEVVKKVFEPDAGSYKAIV
jgi:hypothetical protein